MRFRVLLLLPIMIDTAARAAEPTPTPKAIADIARCRVLTEAGPRLACYDEASKALIEAMEKRTIVVLDKAEVQKTRRSLFGFALPKLPFFNNEREDEKEDREVIAELETTIVSVRGFGYGLWTMTLAEGGVWRTTEPSRTLTPYAGDKVVIKRGPLGGYMATIGGARQIRLQRIG